MGNLVSQVLRDTGSNGPGNTARFLSVSGDVVDSKCGNVFLKQNTHAYTKSWIKTFKNIFRNALLRWQEIKDNYWRSKIIRESFPKR